MDRQSFGPDDHPHRKFSVQQIQSAAFANPYCNPWPSVRKFPWQDSRSHSEVYIGESGPEVHTRKLTTASIISVSAKFGLARK